MDFRKDIRKAFETIIHTYATANTIPIAFENAKFTPPSVTYLRTFLVPSATLNTSIEYGSNNPTGFFQIDIVGELNGGTKKIEELQASIAALYPEGTRIGPVRITRPVAVLAGNNDKDRYVLTLSIYYSLV